MSIDTSGNIYVYQGSGQYTASTWSVLEFSSSATGNVAPSRVITATNPVQLTNPYLSALDTSGNLYIVSEETAGITITEFASNGTTAASPVKTIVGAATNLSNLLLPLALRIDGVGNLYVLGDGASGIAVEGFGATGSGNLAPAIQFTSSSLASTSVILGLALK
jgi:hypothetical protein